MGSFYDLDYIIEMNEERLEQYSNLHQKNVDKFTTILVLYSVFASFLIPIIQSLFFATAKYHWLYHISFCVFIFLLTISLINTILLLIPVDIARLSEPKLYYEEYKYGYEDENVTPDEVDTLIKSSYISELEKAIEINKNIIDRKGLFYNRAFAYAISSCIPYLICIGFLLSIEDNKLQRIGIINNFHNFNKTEYMAKKTARMRVCDIPRGINSNLPGVDNSKVIPSYPELMTEGLDVRFIWDNPLVSVIKDSLIKLFRQR